MWWADEGKWDDSIFVLVFVIAFEIAAECTTCLRHTVYNSYFSSWVLLLHWRSENLPGRGKMRRGWRWPSTCHKPRVRLWKPRPPPLAARIYLWPPPWTPSARSSAPSRRPSSCRIEYPLPVRRRPPPPPYWRSEHVSFWLRWMKTSLQACDRRLLLVVLLNSQKSQITESTAKTSALWILQLTCWLCSTVDRNVVRDLEWRQQVILQNHSKRWTSAKYRPFAVHRISDAFFGWRRKRRVAAVLRLIRILFMFIIMQLCMTPLSLWI